ncbi:MAG: DUF502 domain-containing protein [Acidobacteriota bacterium]
MVKNKTRSFLKRNFVAGLLIIFPLLITVFLFIYLISRVNRYITPLIYRGLELVGLSLPFAGFWGTLISFTLGLFSTLIIILLIGVIGSNILGRRVISAFDTLMLRIPLIKVIYGSVKQISGALAPKTKEELSFEKVALVEYPRKGLWVIGLITKESTLKTERGTDAGLMYVFLPTTPNPTSGMMVLVPKEDIKLLNMTVEEALKLIVSAGLVAPKPLEIIINAKKKLVSSNRED